VLITVPFCPLQQKNWLKVQIFAFSGLFRRKLLFRNMFYPISLCCKPIIIIVVDALQINNHYIQRFDAERIIIFQA